MRIKKLLLAVMLLSLFVSWQPAKAQEASSNGSGLSISPTRTELRVNPGESTTLRINLRNVTGGNIVAQAFINDFTSDNVTGEPRINLDTNAESETSIRRFLKGVADVSLNRGEEKAFDIAVEVPADTSPGAYYGVVRYAAVPVGNAAPVPGQVALTASVASIVLIEVAGDIREQVELKNVQVYRSDKTSTFFVSKPNQIGVELSNLGNGFARPFGTVSVKNPFGSQSYSYELNDSTPRGNILPGSRRTFKNDIKGLTWPGRYQVTAYVSFGNGGEVLTKSKSFWYFPAWFIVLLIVIIGLIAVLVHRLRGKLTTVRRRR